MTGDEIGEDEGCRIGMEVECRIEALPFLYKLRGGLGAWIPQTQTWLLIQSAFV
jgi:hypothetical protein